MYRDFPLNIHQNAQAAAEAANCANAKGKFWEYHDKLFANQTALGKDQLKKYATDVGLNGDEFVACLDGGKYRADIAADQKDGESLGVTGTPAFFVNGRMLSGAQPYEAFQSIIDEELKRGGSAGSRN